MYRNVVDELSHLHPLVRWEYASFLENRRGAELEWRIQQMGLGFPGIVGDWKSAILVEGLITAAARWVDGQVVVTAASELPPTEKYGQDRPIFLGDKVPLRVVIPSLQWLKRDAISVLKRGRYLEDLGQLSNLSQYGSQLLKDAAGLAYLAETIDTYESVGKEIVIRTVRQDRERLTDVIWASRLMSTWKTTHALSEQDSALLDRLISRWNITPDELHAKEDLVESFQKSRGKVTEREVERV